MTLPIIAIRPEPGCTATVAAGAVLGLRIERWPLFEIRARGWDLPPLETIDALLIGSANALHHGGPALDRLRDKPVLAVGEVTAAAARARGFAVAMTGTGGLQSLLDGMAGPVRLLRLAGDDHVSLIVPPAISVETRIVYASVALPMPADLAKVLRTEAVVLLHSGGAARHLADQCARCGVAKGAVEVVALAPRVAELAGGGWRSVQVADEPSDGALLALAADLCHVSRSGEGR
ncbi:MAG: uroporphyrinogen-III synthase [Croceibacterium sp.]